MQQNDVIHQFTNLYPLSKTLRFELIPQRETLENITKSGILDRDTRRADAYQLVKKIIDNYHKFFIGTVLEAVRLDGVEDFKTLYDITLRDEKEKKLLVEIQSGLRKQIANAFSKHKSFGSLFKKELFSNDLRAFVTTADELALIEEFDSFTSYFTGFHENRKNMYSAEEKSTAIAFRLINQNLPKFIDNAKIFDKVCQTTVKEFFPNIEKELQVILQVERLEEMFALDYFNETLSQRGIDVYNQVIGGYTVDDGKTKIKGINEYINLYNQQQADKKNRIAKLKPLFKQILSDRNTISFLAENFDSDAEVLESIESCYQELHEYLFSNSNQEKNALQDLLLNIGDFDLNGIFIKNDVGLTDIGQKMFGNWNIFVQALSMEFAASYKGKERPGTEKYEKLISAYCGKESSFSISRLNQLLLLLPDETVHRDIATYFVNAKRDKDATTNLFDTILIQYKAVEEILKGYPIEDNVAQDKLAVEKIKSFLDAIKALQLFIKPLLGKGDESNKDEKFYVDFLIIWEKLDELTLLYNKVRNYMTRKPYSTSKMKLNFDNGQLLEGWDANKEEANTSVLFRDGDKYFLGIMDKKHTKIFRDIKETEGGDYYEKIIYKLLPGASKMLPKVFFSDKNIAYFKPSAQIIDIRNYGRHTKGGEPQKGYEKMDFNLNECHQMIDFFKESIEKHNDWKYFGFKFSDTKTYNSINEFYAEVEAQGYSINFINIDKTEIHKMVAEGKLYLFQIYNKDFSPNSKGTPNMHTIYWRMLFDKKNLENVFYKLNGEAEVFYRKASISDKNIITHKANLAIENKNIANAKKQSQFIYDIIKDKRFTVDKFQFHVPIKLNFKATGTNNINPSVNAALRDGNISHIIGIDRGERHLLYLSLIDIKGNLIKQFSLNEIVNEYAGNTYITNYHDLLAQRQGNRDDARKSWQTIETIKELKEGYISQVIHKITDLMISYNAIVVLEDLNFGFKQGRQKVEKSVYQKFEKMLIDKLNYYVDKQKDPLEIGGALHALQLTNQFESFKKMGKQTGFLFYVPAWNTSKIDPVTGFVNLFFTKYENVLKSQDFFSKFHAIRYNHDKNYFEFVVDNYNAFNGKAEGTKQDWVICTQGDRIETFRNQEKNNQWDNRIVNVTDRCIALFAKYSIAYQHQDLKSAIIQQSERDFFVELFYILKLTLQMRNSITNSEVDYLISPVADRNGRFYDSRVGIENLPKDADANGAYNIARKGLWIAEQMKVADGDLSKVKLAISNKEWLTFVQNI